MKKKTMGIHLIAAPLVLVLAFISAGKDSKNPAPDAGIHSADSSSSVSWADEEKELPSVNWADEEKEQAAVSQADAWKEQSSAGWADTGKTQPYENWQAQSSASGQGAQDNSYSMQGIPETAGSGSYTFYTDEPDGRGDASVQQSSQQEAESYTYIINTTTKYFHLPGGCKYINRYSEPEECITTNSSMEELRSQGWLKCRHCFG